MQPPDSASRRLTFVLAGAGFAGVEVVAELNGGATLSDGRRIETETVVWTAGVTPNPLLAELGLPLDEHGRVPVDETLRLRGQMATLGSRDGIALVGGLPVRGLPGWLIARGYHVLQLPFVARRIRVLADWSAAALFRRDVAELSSLTPRRSES